MSEPPVDRPEDVRAEDRLEVDRLRAYLAPRLPGFEGSIEVLQFPSGASNRTYLVRGSGPDLVLRMPPTGTKARTAHDMGREFRVLERLRPHLPLCPRPVLACNDPAVLGEPFYLMERIGGLILRRDLPTGLEFPPQQARRLCEALVDTQARLHAVDWREGGLADLGRPDGYVERQVRGWGERYRNARTPDVPTGESVIDWLQANRPVDTPGGAVVHNDYRLDNVVLDPALPTRILGILDWEMATLGDPWMDLGCSLAYWVEAGDPPELQRLRLQPSHLPGMMSRREMVARYAEVSGRPLPDMAFYEVFGLFRLAVIAQQIYYRYVRGETRHPRAAALGGFVPVLLAAAGRRAGIA